MDYENKPEIKKPCAFPTEGREKCFAFAALIAGLILCNFTLFGGFGLGFAMGMDLCILASASYLLSRGHRLTAYSALLLILSLVIGAGFARSDDGFVKLVMLVFLFVSVNLGLTLLAGQQRHAAGGISSLGDCFYTAIFHSFGRMGPALSGLKRATAPKEKGSGRFLPILGGLLIALPLVFLVKALLTRADAAFEALLGRLPGFHFGELIATVFCGAIIFLILYCRGVSLHHREPAAAPVKVRKGINALTVNTVLAAVCLVYLLYLISQLAYFVGGFAGILPEGYTMAEYARRGFFEMAVLCGINMTVIGLCMGLVSKRPGAPLSTKLLCLFMSLVTVFFVVSASGKMFMYMDSYGLTRLRVLTQVIMLWMGLSTVAVAVWLFAPRFPYMKAVIAAALIIGATVLWGDVDSVIARYNVDRYLDGSMAQIDTAYLRQLNRSAIPHVARLAEQAPDAAVQEEARRLLEEGEERFFLSRWSLDPDGDFREWNYAKQQAKKYLKY